MVKFLSQCSSFLNPPSSACVLRRDFRVVGPAATAYCLPRPSLAAALLGPRRPGRSPSRTSCLLQESRCASWARGASMRARDPHAGDSQMWVSSSSSCPLASSCLAHTFSRFGRTQKQIQDLLPKHTPLLAFPVSVSWLSNQLSKLDTSGHSDNPSTLKHSTSNMSLRPLNTASHVCHSRRAAAHCGPGYQDPCLAPCSQFHS